MKNIFLLMIILCLSLCLIGCGGGGGGSSKSSKGNIVLTVRNNKTFITNTQVTLFNDKDKYLGVTNDKGIVTFNNINVGSYFVEVEGYEVTNTVSVIKDMTVEETVNVDEVSSKITFIFYGNSYDLDKGLRNNMKEMFQYGSTNKVNVIVMYKLSDNRVFRGKVEKSDGSDITKGLEELSPRLFSNASNLEEFIIWAKNKYPADTYILDLWNHGSGWHPDYDNRAINHEEDKSCMEIYDLHTVLQGKNIEYLLFDACNMQFIEVLAQLKDDVSYSIASEEAIPSRGYNYTNLFTYLNTKNNINDALIAFCKAQVEEPSWTSIGTDIKFNNMERIDNLNERISDISDFLYENSNKYRDEVNNARRNIPNIYYAGKDINSFLTEFGNEINNSEFNNLLKAYISEEKSVFLYNKTIDTKKGFLVNIPNANIWRDKYAISYPKTAFAKSTGWDKFLETIR